MRSATRYDSADAAGPICTASSAMRTCKDLASGRSRQQQFNAKPFARLHDANGDLAAIGNEDFVEQLLARHLRLGGGGGRGGVKQKGICGSGRPKCSAICDNKVPERYQFTTVIMVSLIIL